MQVETLRITTTESNVIKNIIESLKDILRDANFQISSEGIKCKAIDTTQTAFVNMFLEAENFDEFECKKPTVLGIDIIVFHKIIKQIQNEDVITLIQYENEQDKLIIRFSNAEKMYVKEFELRLMDLDEEKYENDELDFKSIITMPSNEFQKICRDFNSMSDSIEIMSIGSKNELQFSCKGEFTSCKLTIGKGDDAGMSYIKNENPDPIVQGVFSLYHLCQFAKCTNLCNSIEINLANNVPLVIKYACADLGNIKFYLAQKLEN